MIFQRSLISNFFTEVNKRLSELDVMTLLKVSSVLFLAMLLFCILVLVNDKMYDASIRRRVKTHHLTIRNNGNSASLYLLHTVDLPKTLAVRFRIDGNPLIWVSLDKKDGVKDQNPDSDKEDEENKETVQTPSGEERSVHETLIPKLDNPMAAVGAVTKAVSDVGKKAGFFASIFSTVSSLLPKSSSLLNEAQSSLKGFQQDTNQLVGSINTKANAVNSLGDQLGKLPMADKLGDMAKSSGAETVEKLKAEAKGSFQQYSESEHGTENGAASNLNLGGNFVYDESIWQKNIGKVDEQGGALNYAQSRILQPGESMKIDIEIMNLSENNSSVSQLYKIEVLQVPQTSIRFSSVSRFLNGIVVFDKTRQFDIILPTAVSFTLIILVIQIIALYTYLIF